MKRAALFGHIQRNNLKSLALLALFLVLIEASQIAVRLVPAAISVNSATLMNPAARFDNAEIRPAPRGREPGSSGWIVVSKQPQGEHGIGAAWRKLVTESSFFERDWYLILAIGFTYIALACWRSVVLMRYETGARPMQRAEAPELHDLVENLAISIGLPCPRIEIIESEKRNAYAAGFFPKASTIAVTRGLIRELSRDELEAVLAHEMVHIRDRDVRLMVVARACVDLVLPISSVLAGFVRKRVVTSVLLGLVLLAALGMAVAFVIATILATIALLALGTRLAISQTREFTADAGAIELTKNPEALISALRKVARDDDLPLLGYASRAMMFSARHESFLGRLLGSHPSIEARIEAIMLHGGVTAVDMRRGAIGARSSAHSTAAAPASFGARRVVHGMGGRTLQLPGTAGGAVARQTAASRPELGGRLPGTADPDPGKRPIAEPRLTQTMNESTAPSGRIGDWLVGRKADRIAGRLAGFLETSIVAIFHVYLGLFVLAVGLIVLAVKPLVALAVLVLAVWILTGRARRDVDFLVQLVRGSGTR